MLCKQERSRCMSVDLDIRYKVPSLIGFVHLIHEINCLLSDMVSNCKVETVAHSLYSVIQIMAKFDIHLFYEAFGLGTYILTD